MKTFKRTLSLLLVAVMLVAAVPFFAAADAVNYELILNVDGREVNKKADRPTASIDMENESLTEGKVDQQLQAMIDGLYVLNLFNVTGFGADSYNFKEVVINSEKKIIRVELTKITATEPSEEPTTTPTEPANVTYTVKLTVDGVAQTDKTLTYKDGAVADLSTWDKVMEEIKMDASKYDMVSFTNVNNVITLSIKTKVPSPASVTYTVKLTVDGVAQTDKTLTYKDGAVADLSTWEKVMKEIGMEKDVSKYDMVSFTNVNNVITLSLKTKAPSATTVKITLNDGTKETIQYPEVGKYYSDYAVFYPSAQDGRTPESLKIEENNGSVRVVDVGTKTENGKVRATDVKVTIQWKAADRQIRFYTDSTLGKIFKTLTVYSGKAIGELPTEVNGKAVEYWTVWGTRIYSTTTYSWTADYVNAVPHFVGESGKVYLEIYVNGNRTSKYTQVDITHKLQDGVIYRDTLLDTIRNAVKNNSLKLSSVSYLFDESEWSAYVRNVNNTTTNTKIQIGENLNDARYIYVMVNGVTTKTADSTNPKTGDTAKLGVAAAVLAVAVVGFGAAIVVNKKKGVR